MFIKAMLRLGRLIYLSHIRPIYAVGVVSQFMHNPNKSTSILFKKVSELMTEAYSDVDYAESLADRRSTTSYYIFLGGNFVTWRSKKQAVVVRSNVEVEFRVVAHEICESLWLKIILNDLKLKGKGV